MLRDVAPLTFLTWKWKAPNGARSFQSKHVNVVYAMVARWYQRPFRFVCLTDEAKGLDERIEARPLPVRFDQLANPLGPRFPNCYCRLWTFSREAAELGERIFQLDIDVMITGDLCPLVDRDEDFVGWTDKRFEEHKIAGGAFLLRTGALPEVWEDFDPKNSPPAAKAAGFKGSDQAWISYRLDNGKLKMASPHELSECPNPYFCSYHATTSLNAGLQDTSLCYPPDHAAVKPSLPSRIGTWPPGDLIKINWTSRDSYSPPVGARMIFTSGARPPWDKQLRREYPWVRKVWMNA